MGKFLTGIFFSTLWLSTLWLSTLWHSLPKLGLSAHKPGIKKPRRLPFQLFNVRSQRLMGYWCVCFGDGSLTALPTSPRAGRVVCARNDPLLDVCGADAAGVTHGMVDDARAESRREGLNARFASCLWGFSSQCSVGQRERSVGGRTGVANTCCPASSVKRPAPGWDPVGQTT